MNLQRDRINTLQSDNDKLSETIIRLSRDNEKGSTTYLTAGALGVVVGIALGVLVTK